MKSFINVENIEKTLEVKVKGRNGQEITEFIYPECGFADFLAQWLVGISSSKQNKYVVCKDWNKTRNKELMDVNINDLSIDAQDWVFTMTLLAAATKDNAIIPSRDGDENTLAKDYSIPSATKVSSIIKYGHRVGLTELLAEKEKFVAVTRRKFLVDKSRILSPVACNSFWREWGEDKAAKESYKTDGAKELHSFEGLFTDEACETFEATLNLQPKVSKELAQILLIASPMIAGFGRVQEYLSDEVLLNWMMGTSTKDTANTNN